MPNVSFQKASSPVVVGLQFVAIIDTNILIAISTFGNIDSRLSFFIMAWIIIDIDGTDVFENDTDVIVFHVFAF